MKRFQFLLLDAGPIIKLFELGIWDEFINRCDVTVCGTVVEEAKWASQECRDVYIDLGSYEQKNLIRIVHVELAVISAFCDKFDASYKAAIHDGEKETPAFLDSSPEAWVVRAADGAVFRVLGVLGKAERGMSLEEVLRQVGLGHSLEWKYSEKFRRKYTSIGQADSIQGQDLP